MAALGSRSGYTTQLHIAATAGLMCQLWFKIKSAKLKMAVIRRDICRQFIKWSLWCAHMRWEDAGVELSACSDIVVILSGNVSIIESV